MCENRQRGGGGANDGDHYSASVAMLARLLFLIPWNKRKKKSNERRDRSQEAMASTFAEGLHLLSVASRDILQKEAKNRHTGVRKIKEMRRGAAWH